MIRLLIAHRASLQHTDCCVHGKQPCKAKKSIMVCGDTVFALLLQFFPHQHLAPAYIAEKAPVQNPDFLRITSRENKDNLGLPMDISDSLDLAGQRSTVPSCWQHRGCMYKIFLQHSIFTSALTTHYSPATLILMFPETLL